MQRTPAQRVHGRAPRGVVDLAADHLGAGPRPPRSSERFELVESGTLGRADAMMESTAGEACSLGQRIGVRGRGEARVAVAPWPASLRAVSEMPRLR